MTKEEALKTWLPIISMSIDNIPELKEAFDMAIKALEQEPILDKIRAEIANHCGINTDYCDSCRFCTDSIGVREILQIIDKYKAESEPKKSEDKE